MKIGGVLRDCLWVSLVALLIRGGILATTPNALREDRDDYRRLAANLVADGTFGTGDVPTAFRPPLYSLLLTTCVPFGDYGCLAIMVLHTLLGVATVAMVLVLGRWWGLGSRGAALAALLVACDPILLASSSLVMTETLATFLTTAGLLTLTWAGQHGKEEIAGSQRLPECAERGDSPPGAVGSRLFSRYLLAGIVLALAALCRPAFLLWTLAAGVVLVWQALRGAKGDSPIFAETKIGTVPTTKFGTVPETKTGTVPNSRGPTARGRIAKYLCAPVAFALGALIVLSPWAIRNHIQFGHPIVTTTHGGYTLLLGNNPEFYGWLRAGSCGSVWQADHFNFDWESRRPSNELYADQQAYAEAWENIRAEPGMFLYACVVRIGRFWSPLPHQLTPAETPRHRLSRYAVALWYIAEFLLAICGIWRLLRFSPLHVSHWALKRPALSWLWGFLLVGCLLAGHVVYWTDMRMRAPVMPVVALVAACGLCGRKKCHE